MRDDNRARKSAFPRHGPGSFHGSQMRRRGSRPHRLRRSTASRPKRLWRGRAFARSAIESTPVRPGTRESPCPAGRARPPGPPDLRWHSSRTPLAFLLRTKSFTTQSAVAKKYRRCPLMLSAHAADHSFHVAEITFQGPPAGGRQTVFGFGRASVKGLRAMDVTSVFELARVHAQIAVGRANGVLELVERERFIDRQRADYPQAQPLVNQTIDFVHAVWRTAVHRPQTLLFALHFSGFALQRLLFSHRISSQ